MTTTESEPPAGTVATSHVFPPYRERPVPWTLLGFIALSVGAHAFAFLLFQVVYPQRVTIPPPAVQVSVLNPTTPEQEAIIRWVAAEDPALAAASPGAIPPSLFELAYQPSYATRRTPPRMVPAEAERPQAAPSPITLPLLVEPGAPSPAVAAPKGAEDGASSVATFAGALAGRLFHPAGALRAHATGSLTAASFLLAVDADGAVRYVFLHGGSGDAATDRAAEEYLAGGTFTPDEGSGLSWGMATVTWGREVYATKGRAP